MGEQRVVLHYIIEMKRLVLSAVVLFLLLSATSCSKRDVDSGERDNCAYPVDTTCYASQVISLPDRSSVIGADLLEDDYYIFLSVLSEDYSERSSRLLIIDDGIIEKEYELNTEAYDVCLLDDKTAVVSTGSDCVLFDIETNEVIRQLDVSCDAYYRYDQTIVSCDDSFIIAYDGFIARFDSEGDLLNTITSPKIYDVIGYSDENILMDYLNPAVYHVDWNAGSVDYASALFAESGEYVGYHLSGEQLLSVVSHDLFNVDLSDCSKTLSVSGYNTLFYPGKPGSNDMKFISIDSNHYAVLYNENGNNEELAIVEPDPELDLNSREQIVVGGMGFRNDPYFESIRYSYNSSQNDYLVVTRDYGDYQGADEPMQEFQLRILRDISNGEAPDIFYGTMFDYNYLGRNGMVIDMMPLISNDLNTDIDDIQPFIRDQLVNDDGTCFRMIAGYYTVGFIGMRDNFPDNEVSIYDLPVLGEGQRLMSGKSPEALIQDAIVFALPELIKQNRSENGSAEISSEQMCNLIEYALEYGNSRGDIYSYGSTDDVINNRILLSDDAYLVSQLNLMRTDYVFGGRGLTYVGYPSIYGSIHPAYPTLEMAISGSADSPVACWDFIGSILSEETQISLLSGENMRYPVVSSIMEGFIDSALEYETIDPDSPYYDAVVNIGLFADNPYMYTEDDLLTYREFGESVDVICYHDYGIGAIVEDEIDEYFNSGKTVQEIAESMSSRINLYYQENYT